MTNLTDAASLAELISVRAEQLPEQEFLFLEDGENREVNLPYAELEKRTTALGAALRARANVGDRILVLVPLGLEYTMAMLACATAGVVAVPAYPPEPGAQPSALAPIAAVADDCRPVLALLGADVAKTLATMDVPASLARLPQVVFGDLEQAGEGARRDWSVDAQTNAVILYTSGSTGNPKGVQLSHGNFLHVCRAMATDCRLDRASTFCIWLPGYHISGLYSGIMLPLWAGSRCIGFSPRSFVEKPVRWLKAIDRYRATVSGAPTFAYDVLTRAVTPAQSEGLDLSSWQLAVVGGEAVRRDVIERFSTRFEANGFSRERFYTMFGLTEAVMISTGSGFQTGPVEEWVDRDKLQEGRAVPVPASHPSARASIASGFPLPETQVLVVDPATKTPLGERRVGEVWIGGDGVGRGYWQRDELNAELFQARTADGAGPFLRTGDLGYFGGGQVNIVGRLKEMIIIRGLNFYPDDLETSVQRSDPRLAHARLATFAAELDGEEKLAIAIEWNGEPDPAIAAAVRRSITADHGIQVGALVVLPPGAIPVTSTGKVQRSRCAQLVASGAWKVEGRTAEVEAADVRFDPAAFATLPAAGKRTEAIRMLRRIVAKLASLGEDAIAADRPLPEFGIDSILTVKLSLEIQDRFSVVVPTARLRDATTIEALADLILAGGKGAEDAVVTDRGLDPAIRPEGPVATGAAPQTLFLTGATGFLGGFLLHELLKQTDARVCCLIRADNPEAGLARLAAKLKAIGVWEDAYAQRLVAVNGDLSRPQLGLDDATFAELARTVDAIYHNGASVDFVAPYAALEQANVGSVEDCLRLATTGKTKPVHFTSTLAVFNGSGRMALRRIAENERLPDPQQLVGGYAQSKWVAESLLTQAGERGLPVGIYRAGFIGGHAETGFWNTEDFLCRMIKGSVQLGVYPDISVDVPFVSVDYVAKAIVALSRGVQPGASHFHLIAPQPLSMRNLMRWTGELGHAMRAIPYARWKRMLREALPMTNDLYPVLPFLIEPGVDGNTVIEIFMQPGQPTWTDAATRERLAPSGVKAPAGDRAFTQRCVGFFHKVGFLEKPEEVAA